MICLSPIPRPTPQATTLLKPRRWGNLWVVSSRFRSEDAVNQDEEEFANLATDSDYNQLADRVNANRFAPTAVTCCRTRIFCRLREFPMESSNFPNS
jgi:hypothetical protein